MTRFLATLFVLIIALPQIAAAAGGDTKGRKANRLINEASPYLRQHAYNPIDWYPWGKAAFEKAKKEHKPVFLSVGYSTCHWCHVMARESFENDAIAKVLNDNFVAIKVDRERRPNVDETYMLATEIINQRGGWPNSVFLTPDRKPFFAGTYFPPDNFQQILGAITQYWKDDIAALKADAERIANVIQTVMTRRVEAQELTPKALKTAVSSILEELDAFYGGFTTAPKFPNEAVLLFLLHMAEKDNNVGALNAVSLTLDGILNGGIQDHVGGGFHRYAVDAQWRVPHFEKMLYNQALLTQVLVRAYRLTGTPRYAAAIRRALDYVLADLTDPTGGFYSARDADSEGKEGTFYVWTPETMRAALGPDDAKLAEKVFGVTKDGNFEGHTVLHFPEAPEDLAVEIGMKLSVLNDRLAAIRTRLESVRAKREAPHRDEKVVTAWNGMMITAFAEAAAALGEPRYKAAALKAATFLWETLHDETGLKRAYFEGKVALAGQQEDYAYTAVAFLALYDLTHDATWLKRAETLSQEMVGKFRDAEVGDYFMTASTDTFSRAKSRTDGATPSGNAMALDMFARLARRTRNPENRLKGEALLAAISGISVQSPMGSGYALRAADTLLRGETGPNRFLAKGVVRAEAQFDRARRQLTVRLAMADGWHVNSDKPLEEFFIPTELSVEGMDKVEVVYPKPLKRKLGFHDKDLALYEGTVELKATLPATSAKRMRAKLRLQACSDKICLEPETAILTVPNHGQ
ncbi:MAG: DUF255 domain-containing protein [Methyloligellaceae bacterium]